MSDQLASLNLPLSEIPTSQIIDQVEVITTMNNNLENNYHDIEVIENVENKNDDVSDRTADVSIIDSTENISEEIHQRIE